jgi:ribosomal protein L29
MAKDIENLKEMSEAELKNKLSSLEENLRVLKFKTEGSRSKNVKEHITLRKQVARVLTEINSDARSESRPKSVGIKNNQ